MKFSKIFCLFPWKIITFIWKKKRKSKILITSTTAFCCHRKFATKDEKVTSLFIMIKITSSKQVKEHSFSFFRTILTCLTEIKQKTCSWKIIWNIIIWLHKLRCTSAMQSEVGQLCEGILWEIWKRQPQFLLSPPLQRCGVEKLIKSPICLM